MVLQQLVLSGLTRIILKPEVFLGALPRGYIIRNLGGNFVKKFEP